MASQSRSAVSSPIAILFVVMSVVLGVAVLIEALEASTVSVVGGGFALLVLLFFKLSVLVSEDQIVVSFGVGIVRREFDIHALTALEVVPNSSIGSLYNPKAESVLYIADRTGRSGIIPLFEPRALLGSLRSRIRD
jgi:hypothetical protein